MIVVVIHGDADADGDGADDDHGQDDNDNDDGSFVEQHFRMPDVSDLDSQIWTSEFCKMDLGQIHMGPSNNPYQSFDLLVRGGVGHSRPTKITGHRKTIQDEM
mgnify:CR=1 FL=1